jgi:hypothetical protein
VDASRSGALVIACGALAHEIAALRRLNGWDALDVQCLPPELHNFPDQIPGRVREAIDAGREKYASIFIAYADCGTGGRLDALLEPLGIERLPGAHCYEFYATAQRFAEMHGQEPGTFYLTDFLVRHFERLVAQTLGIDRHPQLIGEYFRNYRRVVYLVQDAANADVEHARAIAGRLGLEFSVLETGYGQMEAGLRRVAMPNAGAAAANSNATNEVRVSWPR